MLLRKIILTLIVVFNCGFGFGQVYKNFYTLDHIYKYWLLNNCDTLHYSEKISPEILDNTIKLIASKRIFPLYALYNGTETKPLIITPEEQLYLITELNKLKKFTWPMGMFPKSKRVSLEYIKSLYPIANNQANDISKDCEIIYSFSKPIFFRNGTICLYIDQELYSNSSNRLFTQFYQIIKGHWEEYADVYMHIPGYDENMQIVGNNDSQEQKNELITEKILPDQSKLTDEQLQEFGKKVLGILYSGTLDSIHLIFPNPNQGEKIIKYLGKQNTFSYKVLGVYFLINSGKVIDSAKVLNIDWSKTKYIGIKKFTTLSTVKRDSNLPLTFTNLQVIFSCDSRKFLLEFKGLYLVDNEVKTTGIGKIKEIND